MNTALTLAEVRRRHIAIEPHEAVAIARKLLTECSENAAARPPFGPPSSESVAITADGFVLCTCSDTTPSVPEVAIVLQELFAHSDVRVPGGLRYAVGRALLEVEAPPFDSAAEFVEALERFERGDRRAVIAGLYSRAAAAAPELLVSGNAQSDGDRRRRMPSATEIRRQLRDADLRLYQIRQLAQGPPVPAASARKRTLRAPVAACMLAGLAFVAAGEVTRGLPYARELEYVGAGLQTRPTSIQTRPTSSGLKTPRDVPQSTNVVPQATTNVARNTDITLPAELAFAAAPQHDPAPEVPTSVAARPRRPQTHASTTRVAAARQRSAPAQTRTTSNSRPDDGRGLLRIRFEWNNPFK